MRGHLVSGRPVRLFFAVVVFLPGLAAAVTLPVVEQALPNGLTVLLHEDHSAPVVSSYVFYRSGSRNEVRGATGIAHLFEHMMFNGGRTFGPGEFDDRIEGSGGSTNGYTTRDYTAYLNNFPREALPVVLALEADRMAHLALTSQNLEQERGIVMEERRLRIDNDVGGALNEALYLHAFVQSPYRWNPVGFMGDLRQITLEQARAWYRTYYAPNNAVLVLAGDLEPSAALALVRRHFASIPRQQPPAPVDATEPPQEGERRAEVRKHAELPAVLVGYHGPRAVDPDRPALDVVAALLADGESSRLYHDLVREHEVATQVSADLDWGADPNLFAIYAQARPGRSAKDLDARIDAVLAELASGPVGPDELAKAKRRLRAHYVRGLKTVSGKANQLGYFAVVFGDHRRLFDVESGWEVVSAGDVQRVVGTYLVPSRRTLIELVPTTPAAGGAGA
jgi:predicted Zn-dependent peptidase